MSRPLKRHHWMSLNRLADKQRFGELNEKLVKLSAKGFDVAAVPFRLLDEALSFGEPSHCAGLGAIADHTPGGQPQLIRAALADLQGRQPAQLMDLVQDATCHPMTRFEAMGWACHVAHGGLLGDDDVPTGPVVQFWDTAAPPPEIAAACADWASASEGHHLYTEEEAYAFIQSHFGQSAADGFHALWHPAVKSDLFRLYRLAQEGGLYCDADSTPQQRCAKLLASGGGQVWMSSMTNMPNCVVNNWLIAAPPKHPFIEALLEDVLQALQSAEDRAIFWLSGPGAYTRFTYENLGAFDVGLLPNAALKTHYFRQFDAPYKHTAQNWRVYEHAQGLNNDAGLAQALAAQG